MQLFIKSKNIKLTEAIKVFIKKASFKKFERLKNRIVNLEVTVEASRKRAKSDKKYKVSSKVETTRGFSVFEKVGDNVYELINKSLEGLKDQIRKQKEKTLVKRVKQI